MGTGNPTGRPRTKFVGESGYDGVALLDAEAAFRSGGVVGNAGPLALTSRYGVPAYNEEYAQSACDALESGITLREHCRMQRQVDPSYPSANTFYCWAVDNVQGFANRYARSRYLLLQHWAEEIIEISDDGRNDWMERRLKDGTITKQVDHECVQRSKLRCDNRKWVLSKLVPEFGDKIMHQQLGAHGQPVDPPSAVNPIDLSVELHGWKPKD